MTALPLRLRPFLLSTLVLTLATSAAVCAPPMPAGIAGPTAAAGPRPDGDRSGGAAGTPLFERVDSRPIGTLEGTFSVDPNGAATYQVPLEVPPGTAGATPELALTYNHQRDNGYLGMGWALNGIQSISRCNATQVPDGFTAPVSYDARDRFCIGSQKLLAVSGAYGADGTVYRTARDTWTRFVSHGTTCGTGPCWFSAENKDGSVLRFGFTTGSSGSRIPAVGRSDGAVRVWSLDRYTDPNGNYTAVSYSNNALLGEYYPVEVAYTGNESTGLAPQRAVRFVYEPRSDRVTGYSGGSPYQFNHRMIAIRTFVGDTLVKSYPIAYDYGTSTRRSRIVSIRECFTETPSDSTCYPASTFTSTDPSNGLSAGTVRRAGHGTQGTLALLPMDVDGDGISDLVQPWTDGELQLLTYFGSPQGLGPGSAQGTGVSAGELGVIGLDATGDGRGDLVMPVDDGGALSLWAFLSQGRSFGSGIESSTGSTAEQLSFLPMDVDADGRQDLVQVVDRGGRVSFVLHLSKGDGTFAAPTTSDTSVSTENHGFFPMDTNGDGRTDVVQPQSSGGSLRLVIYLSTGTGFEKSAEVSTGRDPDDPKLVVGDVNGDHKGDVILLVSDGSSTEIVPFLGTGTGFRQVTTTTGPGGDDDLGMFAADLNGDGRTDLVESLDDGGKLKLVPYYSLGDRFIEGEASATGRATDTLGLKVMDLDGDHKQDVLDPQDDGGTLDFALFVNTTGQPDLMVRGVNGLGGSVDVTYRPMTDDAVYTRGRGAVYPVRDTETAMPLVAAYTSSDGRGGSYTYRYHYEQGLTGATGIGWLGFRYLTMTDAADGRSSVVTYDQTPPRNGHVAASAVHDAHGVELSSTVMAYEDMASATLRAAGIHQVVRTSEVYTHYDVASGGAKIYSLERRYAYDDYGNVELIADLGQQGVSNDGRFTCVRYSNDEPAWRLGYPLEEMMTTTEAACRAFLDAPEPAWDPDTSLRWRRKEYDDRGNRVADSVWDDSRDAWLTSRVTVDAYGNRVTSSDPAGNVTGFDYDDTYHAFVVRVTSPPNEAGQSLVDSYRYEPAFGTELEHTDPNGNVSTQAIDGFGRLVDRYGPDPSSGAATRIEHTAWGEDENGTYVRLSTRSQWGGSDDPADWQWEETYFDGLMREYRTETRGQTAQTAVVEQVRFDAEGLVSQTSVPHFAGDEPAWVVTEYDVYNRPVRSTTPDGTVEKIDYQLGGLKIYRTSAYGTPEARTEISNVNAHGLVTSRILANGEVYRYTYSRLGQIRQIQTVLDPRTLGFEYDSVGRLRSSTTPDTGERTFDFGPDGLLARTTDAAGNRVAYTYDALGRVVRTDKRTSGGTETVRYTWDGPTANGRGNLTHVAMSSAPLGDYSFDLGYDPYRETATVRVTLDGTGYSYARDHAPTGQVTSEVYPDGSELTTSYWPGGEPKAQSLRPEAGGTPRELVSYTDYNPYGVPLSVSYDNGVEIGRTFYPDDVATGKISSIVARSTATSPARTLYERRIHWDRLDLVTGVVPPPGGDEAGAGETFTYDKVGFLTGADGPYGEPSYDYDSLGNRTAKDGGAYSYEPGTDLLRSVAEDAELRWNANGTLASRTAGGTSWTFTYDAEGRMTRVDRSGASSPGYLAYDFTGNRLFRQPAGEATKVYTISSTYEVTDYGGGKVLHTRYVDGLFGRAVAITTEGSGATAAAVERTNHRMAARLYGTSPDALARIGAAGHRLAAAWSAPEVAAAAAALLLGLALLLALVPALRIRAGRRTGAGATAFARSRPVFAAAAPVLATVLLLTTSVPARADLTPGANGAGNPVVGTLYLVQDLVGSTVAVTDERGEPTAGLTYLPFGAVAQGSSSGTDDFRPKYAGKTFDRDTGLYHFDDREYDPGTGRFTTPDPVQQFVNPYPYAADSPVSMVDPSGDFAFLLAIVVGAVIGAYMGAAAVNHDYNPAHWDWKSGKTYAGLLGGAVVGGVGGAIVEAAAAAGVAAGIAGATLVGAGENAAYTAMGGGSAKEILISAAEGAAFGFVTGAAGAALGRAAARFARRGVSEGLEEVGTRVEQRAAKGVEEACASFLPGQTVLAADGRLLPIEELRVGDRVLGHDGGRGAAGSFEVAATIRGEGRSTVRITTAGGAVIDATPHHRVRVHGMGWLPAAELHDRLSLTDPEGNPVPVAEVRTIEHAEPRAVHNVSVDSAGTYYVSADRALVENVKAACLVAKGKRRPHWRKASKENTFARQRIKSGKYKGYIKSAVSSKKYLRTKKVWIGTNNPRRITIWQLDHKVPYRDLLWAAEKTKSTVTWRDMIAISNFKANLRYMTMSENTSGSNEPLTAAARKGAIAIFKHFGLWS